MNQHRSAFTLSNRHRSVKASYPVEFKHVSRARRLPLKNPIPKFAKEMEDQGILEKCLLDDMNPNPLGHLPGIQMNNYVPIELTVRNL